MLLTAVQHSKLSYCNYPDVYNSLIAPLVYSLKNAVATHHPGDHRIMSGDKNSQLVKSYIDL